jgi:hypothetical protein
LAINDLAPVCVPVIGDNVNVQPSVTTILNHNFDQTIDERQVSASVSTSAVASVPHPEEISLSSPSAITQTDLRDAKPEQNPFVSY